LWHLLLLLLLDGFTVYARNLHSFPTRRSSDLEETSPTGSARRIPRRHVPSPGAEDREYCRSWRAPSGSTTPTEVYWPARNSGSGALSGPARVSTVTDSVTSSRPTTVAVRKTSPGSTPASE